MAISDILNEYIIKSKERLNASNVKTYCKCCVEALGEEEGKKIFFPNKTDRILIHLKKCTHFVEKTTPEIRDQIFSLSKDNEKQGKRLCKLILIDFCIIFLVYFY